MIAGADTSVYAMEKWDIRESTLSSVRYAGRPFFISDSARALLAPYSADSSKLFVRIQFPSCERCISQLVRSLKRNENRLGTTNIILVTEFHDDDEVAEFVRRYDLGGFRFLRCPGVGTVSRPEKLYRLVHVRRHRRTSAQRICWFAPNTTITCTTTISPNCRDGRNNESYISDFYR